MAIAEKIRKQINNGVLLDEPTLTEEVVHSFWYSLKKKGITPHTYQTTDFLGQTCGLHDSIRKIKLPFINNRNSPMFLEVGEDKRISSFLSLHDLKAEHISSLNNGLFVQRLKDAFDIIKKVPAISYEVELLITTITILQTIDEDIDTSYSHPRLPFSIFVSVGNTDYLIRYIRTAESIVHEAMHLKLSLLELQVPLVNEDNSSTFFSPWKFEMRPIQGVLHGLFVFRVLLDFYLSLYPFYKETDASQFIEYRLEDISKEIKEVFSLLGNDALTEEGECLVRELLTGNFTQIINGRC